MPEYNPQLVRQASEHVAKARKQTQKALDALPRRPHGYQADVSLLESAIAQLNEAYRSLRLADDALGRALEVE
jgi:hypothetical protein